MSNFIKKWYRKLLKSLYLHIILLCTFTTAIAQEQGGQGYSRKSIFRGGFSGFHRKASPLRDTATPVMYPGLPYSHKKDIYQDLFIKNQGNKIKAITITCLDVTGTDSVRVSSIKLKGRKADRKKEYSTITLNDERDSIFLNPLYKKILLGNRGLPSGEYRIFLSVQLKDSTIHRVYAYSVDSMLNCGSGTRQLFDKAYSTQYERRFLGLSSTHNENPSRNNTSKVVRKSTGKIEKSLRVKGFDVSYRTLADKKYAEVYCDGHYIGYYEIDMNQPIADKINARKARLEKNATSGINPALGNNKPVFSQLKEQNRGAQKDREVSGNISITGNVASGQEEYSQQENNFYEVAGQMEVPIMGIPILFEGYYTSQDKGRIAKAGYLRLHYDSDQAKSELMNLISGYKNKYNRASSSGKTYRNIYGNYMNQATAEKGKLWTGLVKDTGIPDPEKFKADTSGLYEAILSAGKNRAHTLSGEPMDSTYSANKAMEQYEEATQRYQRIRELDEKVRSYSRLLEQYNKNNYYDSLIAYEQLKELDYGNMDEKSYRQLSKAAGGLLPPGHNKRFISGLTSLDAGVFSKQVSSYTLNGQTIKGVDVGYDLGIVETGFTYGRIEYVSRDGFLDKYSGYSGRLHFKPVKGHRTGLIYYGYTPSRRMLNEDAFFKDVSVHMPSFKNNPIHIVALTHQGTIRENVKLAAEAATSYRNFEEYSREDVNITEKMSWKIDMEGRVPQTTIDIRGGYEQVGKQFENNTLPLNLSGTQRYLAGATGVFLKSFLTLGVEYNYLVQQNFSSKSAHSKWGFEVKTTSKRYPSASLSYKPFSTFRSFTDTFSMPQRPILGSVWLGKLSYQLKNKAYTLRLTAIYNRNTALMDTLESNSSLAQLNTIYTRGKLNLMLNAGQTRMRAGNLSPVHGTTNFITMAAGYSINTQWNISIGQDVGTRKSGLSRYGANLGFGYRFRKAPLSIRTGLRYNTYRINEVQQWKNVYAGLLDINWQFRFKMKDHI